MAQQEYRIERRGRETNTWDRVGINRRIFTWDEARAFADDMLARGGAQEVRIVYRGRVIDRRRRTPAPTVERGWGR